MASAKEGKKIALAELVSHCQNKILQAKLKNQIHLIEGVGGMMAPMGEQYTVIDWIQQLGIPCILVVGSYLGTLSHTLSAVAVLQMKGIDILALVINESQESHIKLEDTVDCLQSFVQPIPIFPLSYKTVNQSASVEIARLYRHLVDPAAISF
jgi:dethiobiotin synthetase